MVKAVPAILIAFEALNALMKVMAKVAMDWADTPDVRDRSTRDAAQQLAKDELDGHARKRGAKPLASIRADGRRLLIPVCWT